MDLKLKKEELERALKIGGAISKPKTIWGEWVMLDSRLGLVNQGLNLRVQVRLPTSEMDEGRILLHEKTIRDLLPTLEGEIVIEEKRNHLDLRSGKLRSKLLAFSTQNYPPGDEAEAGKDLAIPLKPLQQAVKDVEFAIAPDVDRSSKVAFTGLTLRAENGTLEVIGASDPLLALASVEIESKEARFSFTLPREVCQVISRLEGEKIALSELEGQGRRLEVEGVLIRASLIPARLPDLAPVLGRPRPLRATVLVSELKRALRQIQVFKDRNSKIMTVSLSKGELRLQAISQTAGKAVTTLEAEVEGLAEVGKERVLLGLDLENASGILDRVRTEKVTFQIGARQELVAVPSEGRLYLAITSVPDKDLEDE